MAAKKSKGAETETKPTEGAPPPKKRNEVLNPDLVRKYLVQERLSTSGSTIEQADRLEKHFEHEVNKGDVDAASMLECLPSQREDGSIPENALGCMRSAPSTIPECPFCGMTDVLTTTPAVPKEPEKKGDKKGKGAKKDEPGEIEKSGAPETSEHSAEPPAEATEERAVDGVNPAPSEETPPPATPSPGGTVKTNAAKIRKSKGKNAAASLSAPALDTGEEDGEKPEDKPSDSPPVDAAAKENDDAEPPTGATAADLDAQCERVEKAKDSAERTTALSFWEQGDAIREIHEKKLWAVVRNDDGSPVYRSFGEFTARRFDMSQATAYGHKKVAEVFDRGTAEALGFTRMKELLSAQDLPGGVFSALVGRALKRTESGTNFVLSVRELRDEVAKEKRLLAGPPPPVAASPVETGTAPKSDAVEETEDEHEDRDSDDESDAPESSNRVDHDEDGVVREPEERRARTTEPRTVTLSLADPRVVVPLYRKGSSVKPAKKIEDGCHGSFSGINGATVKVEVVIGEGAELQIVLTFDRPR